MFDGVGGILKAWAKVTCYVGIALSIIMGLLVMMGASVSFAGWQAAGGIFSGLLTMVLGSLGAWLASLVLYAFGQLSEDTSASRACLERLCAQQPPEAPAQASAPAAASPAAPAKSTYVPSNSRASLSGVSADGWTCRRCGTSNGRENLYCKECGEYR